MTVIATCHCGGTRIELPEAPVHATECNCSFCGKVGALWAYYPPEAIRILSATGDALYAPSGINQHHHCTVCGCATHGISPDWTLADIGANTIPTATKFAVNARLIDDFDLGALVVERIDGRNLW